MRNQFSRYLPRYERVGAYPLYSEIAIKSVKAIMITKTVDFYMMPRNLIFFNK